MQKDLNGVRLQENNQSRGELMLDDQKNSKQFKWLIDFRVTIHIPV